MVNNKILNVLAKLNDDKHSSYVVGGYIRDYLLGNETFDVDIATNYLPKDVKSILGLETSTEDKYGSIHFKDSVYNYDITTFRIEAEYEDRKPTKFRYTTSLKEDVNRRDFTINALYCDMDGNIIDLVKGMDDINDHVIRAIGDISTKMAEDPLRMLRAIRFATILNFDIEPRLASFIKQNKVLISSLSYSRRKEELDEIFKNAERGIQLLKEFNILDELEISIPDDIVYCSNPLGIWAQIEFNEGYSFSSNELSIINSVKKILEYGIIDNVVLYQYGLYPSIIAGDILGMFRSYVSEIYTTLPIYSVKDIEISGDEIIEVLGIEPGEKIKNILNDLELRILNKELTNDNNDIKKYILANWQ